MNKRGQSGLKRISIGFFVALSGIILATYGYSANLFLWGRIGLIIMAIGGWILSWSK